MSVKYSSQTVLFSCSEYFSESDIVTAYVPFMCLGMCIFRMHALKELRIAFTSVIQSDVLVASALLADFLVGLRHGQTSWCPRGWGST